MEKNRHIKNVMIIVLLVCLCCLSVAFSYFSQSLMVSGTTEVGLGTTNWNIAFGEITTLNTTGYATGTSNRNSSQDITFSCEFVATNDTCKLSGNLINNGSINALYTGYTMSVSKEDIVMQSDVDTYDDGILNVNLAMPSNWDENVTVLSSGESGSFEVNASLIDITSLDISTKYTVTIKFNFEQSN